jgi:O-methyltransferase
MDNAFVANLFQWDNRAPLRWHRPINRLLALLRVNAQLGPRSFRWGMANVEARVNIFHLASQCAIFKPQGDFVEIGCNSGESSIIIQKVLNDLAPATKFHCFDSFEGLPDLSHHDAADGVYDKGWMQSTLEKFHDNFKAAGIKPPAAVHKGWFEDTIPRELPDRIAFALLDGDLYASTKHVLPHVYERMTPGAICMFGVYYDERVFSRPQTISQYKSPGVKRATDEFLADKPEKVSVLYANEYSNGYFRKR